MSRIALDLDGTCATFQPNAKELAWAGGLFEGEGCFYLRKPGSSRNHFGVPLAIMSMTDEDSIRRFHAAVGGIGSVKIRPISQNMTKPAWVWTTAGFPSTQAIVAMLWFGLGERRKEKATQILKDGRGIGRPRAAAEWQAKDGDVK